MPLSFFNFFRGLEPWTSSSYTFDGQDSHTSPSHLNSYVSNTIGYHYLSNHFISTFHLDIESLIRRNGYPSNKALTEVELRSSGFGTLKMSRNKIKHLPYFLMNSIIRTTNQLLPSIKKSKYYIIRFHRKTLINLVDLVNI